MMDNEFFNDSDEGFEDENVEDRILLRLAKRYIRDWENPMEFFEDVPFRKRYRFNKGAIIEILLPLVNDKLRRFNNRGLPISPLMQLLITLRFYATSSFQIVNGDLRGYSQASVSRIVARVSRILASHLSVYINFSTEEKRRRNKNQFYEMANFPSIIGCIDCTHIRIANPGGNNGEIFRNRKGWFSLNVQAVAGPQREILDIVVRHPGSTHDAVIFDRSGLRCRFELGHLNGILLGDSGYACRSYLLTPVLRPETDAEVRYNTAHKQIRVIVEQLFGVWKRRFPCLHYGLRTKLSTSVAIICATAVLHNISIQHNLEEVIEEELYENIQFEDIINQEQNGVGLAHRNAFILTHFS